LNNAARFKTLQWGFKCDPTLAMLLMYVMLEGDKQCCDNCSIEATSNKSAWLGLGM